MHPGLGGERRLTNTNAGSMRAREQSRAHTPELLIKDEGDYVNLHMKSEKIRKEHWHNQVRTSEVNLYKR